MTKKTKLKTVTIPIPVIGPLYFKIYRPQPGDMWGGVDTSPVPRKLGEPPHGFKKLRNKKTKDEIFAMRFDTGWHEMNWSGGVKLDCLNMEEWERSME